jgi:hypothetical protein
MADKMQPLPWIDSVDCPKSRRSDLKHGWRFDGDDPYVVCDFCGERRDALTGRQI